MRIVAPEHSAMFSAVCKSVGSYAVSPLPPPATLTYSTLHSPIFELFTTFTTDGLETAVQP